jgi:hypothetical protein
MRESISVSVSKQDDPKNSNLDETEATMDESTPSILSATQAGSEDSPVPAEQDARESKSPPVPADESEETKFHECITIHDWVRLERLLKKYDQKYYKRKQDQAEIQEKDKERDETEQREWEEAEKREREEAESSLKPPLSPKRISFSPTPTSKRPSSPFSRRISSATRSPRKSLRRLRHSLQSLSGQKLVDPSEIVSPLLKGDALGRTPLHLACLYKAPEKAILELLQAERLAAKVPDKFGQLPLHFAVQTGQYDHVLNRIMKAFPNALKAKDIQGRTPVGLAVELARQKEDVACPEDPENPFRWTTPTCKEEKNWQFRQEDIWSKVDYFLKYFMKQNKCVIPSEHGLILEALEGGAPPKTINRFISTADKYLVTDDDLAGSAISLCIERQYGLATLEYLLESCREKTTVITDFIHKALVSHYRIGCYVQQPDKSPLGKEIIDWAQQREELEDNNDNIADPMTLMMSPHCRDWWEKLRHIIFFCAYGKDFRENKEIEERHLVHAALTIPATPPSLLQLLLMVYPDTRMELCPIYKALPVHITCTRWKYDILQNKRDSGLSRVLKQLLKPEPEQLVRRYGGRLPLHMALDVGHSWSFVKSFVSMDKKSVGMRDLQTKLFPFQLAAVKLPAKNIAMLLRSSYTPGEWRAFSVREKKKEYTETEIMQGRRQIETIFELLRRHPDAITGKVIYRNPSKAKRLHCAGRVSLHYLSWVYGRGYQGFMLRPANVKLLRDSIINAHISKPLEPWWGRLKHWIWQECRGDAIPHTDDYLIHAALYNPDTPPLIIELLLELFPTAATKPLPGTQSYPLHIAAATTAYHPQDFEIPYSMDNLHLTLLAYKGAARLTQHRRLPLHICIARGKSWNEIRPLVLADPSTLLMQDPQTGLTPFQQMTSFKATSKENCLRFSAMAEKQTRNVDLSQLLAGERATILRDVKKKHDLSVLTAVYELLRHEPSAVGSRKIYTTGSASVMSSGLSEESDYRESNILGVAETLEKFLQDVQSSPAQRSSSQHSPTGQESMRGLLSPEQKKQKSLSMFLREQHDGKSLITPAPHAKGRPSLTSFLVNGSTGTSMWSLSRNSAMYDDYVEPNYNDDSMSSMGASFSSPVLMSPHVNDDGSVSFVTPKSMTPHDNGATRRSRKMRQLPIKLPDLCIDDD